MITLLTAPPGNGKSSKFINMIKADIADGKTVYTCGLPEIDLAVIPVTKKLMTKWFETDVDITHLIDQAKLISEKIESGSDIYDVDEDDITIIPLKYFPPNSVIYGDECQFYFGKLGTIVPMHVFMLSVHRHFGIDFKLATQHPRMVHDYVKSFVSIHLNIRKDWTGRKLDEWGTVQERPDSSASIASAVQKKYFIDKSTFKHYHSASAHIAQKYSIPMKFYIFLLVFVLGSVQTYRVVTRMDEKFDPNEALVAQQQSQLTNTIKGLKDAKKQILDRVAYCVQGATVCTCNTVDFEVLQVSQLDCKQRLTNGI